jgi:hypothetical protein
MTSAPDNESAQVTKRSAGLSYTQVTLGDGI